MYGRRSVWCSGWKSPSLKNQLRRRFLGEILSREDFRSLCNYFSRIVKMLQFRAALFLVVFATAVLCARCDREYALNAVHFVFLNEPFVDTDISALGDIVNNDLGVPSRDGVPPRHITFLDTFLRRHVHSPHWALFGLLGAALESADSTIEWFFVGTAYTRINLHNLGEVLRRRKEDLLVGARLDDGKKLCILHHFSQNREVGYPLLSSGFAIHRSLVKETMRSVERLKPAANQAIEPNFELMMWIYKETRTVLKDAPEFCVMESDAQYITRNASSDPEFVPGCATWSDQRINAARKVPRNIGHKDTPWQEAGDDLGIDFMKSLPFDPTEVLIVVKTAVKHLEDRILLQHDMWANQQSMPSGARIMRFAENSTHIVAPSTNRPIVVSDAGGGNQERGHCGRLFAILKHMHQFENFVKFFVIVDDDTAINMRGLYQAINSTFLVDRREASQRFNVTETFSKREETRNLTIPVQIPEALGYKSFDFTHRVSPLYMGDRYGFGQLAEVASKIPQSYAFISGGGGMVLDRQAIDLIMDCQNCRCHRADEPDDMALGRWSKRIKMDALHHIGFHQAHPTDYNPVVLAMTHGLRAAFHRLKDIDSYNIYLAERLMQKRESLNFPDHHPYGKALRDLTNSRYNLNSVHDEL
eukprot:Selendium_serpulae@DN4241_c0_g1_i1.p1